MKTADFTYNLPKKYIAQQPPNERGSSRLMVLDRNQGFIAHRMYSDIPSLLAKNDVVVLNETKVLKARLFPSIRRTGRKVEILLLGKESDEGGVERWNAMIGGARYVRIGDTLCIGRHDMVIKSRSKDGRVFEVELENAMRIMEEEGHIPLPPYIDREDTTEDEQRYNTVFASSPDSAAAPTASLNLTEDVLGEIEQKGARIAKINLAVGLGTFASVDTENVEDYKIHSEFISVPKDAVEAVNSCTARVWAFGTTVVRTLESASVSKKKIREFTGKSNLYIYPGYDFKIVDVIVTNFHMPGTSLLMLVSAFAGRKNLLKAYEIAKNEDYRFLSYGDSMVIGDFG